MHPMRVLILATHETNEIDQQRAALEQRGVSFEQLTVPGSVHEGSGHTLGDYLKFLPQVARRSLASFDLVHANYGLTAPMALAQPRLPVVLSLWGTDLEGPFRPLSRLCARYCEAVVVMSERMADSLGQDCTVIPHGVDLDRFSPMPRAEARRTIGWDPGAHIVLFPYATDRDVKDYPRARRVVDRASARLGEPIDLRTVSGLPHQEIPTYLNAADVLLLTSRREGSPNTVKEALACKTPVVATDVGDVRERAGDVDGSTVSDDDNELVGGVCAALTRTGRPDSRDAAREVRVERTAAAMYDVYRRVAAAGPSPVLERPSSPKQRRTN
jgi:glycosyltransferase involved in cell wall biosynthesis